MHKRFLATIFLLLQLLVLGARGEDVRPLPSFVVIVDQGKALPHFSDDELWQRGIAITFQVNKTNISPTQAGYRRIIDALRHVPEGYTFCRLLVIRGSASPEGPADNNKRLAHARARAIVDSLRRYVTLPDSAVEERYIDEDYIGLRRLVSASQSPYKKEVVALIDATADRAQLKAKLRRMDGGRLWRSLLRDFFPQLRATRLVMVVSRKPVPVTATPVTPKVEEPKPVVVVPPPPVVEEPAPVVEPPRPRRELIAVKTNLLMDGAWVPNYGWCPMPNIEVEYYPLHGHWTFGASFDMPWWQSSAYNDHTERSTGENHKFFQVRQYQLLARWYTRDGSSPDGFHGFYIQPYLNLAIFGIGFKQDKGWMGEGGGGGVGIGYKLPLGRLGNAATGQPRTRASHWHLEFMAQVGVYAYRYDPYQFTCPIDGTDDGRYYYRYWGSPSLFHKRDHHKMWFGPTRVGITLSYDLIYRSRKAAEKKGGRQ